MAMHYEAEWSEGALEPNRVDDVEGLLRGALESLRRRETDRGVTLVGPHRDDWRLMFNGLDVCSHASQGEQRTLALALRLAGHRLIASIIGTDPVLLLDDVFSELDPERSAALVVHLPSTQTLLTTAGVIPPGIEAERHLTVHEGASCPWGAVVVSDPTSLGSATRSTPFAGSSAWARRRRSTRLPRAGMDWSVPRSPRTAGRRPSVAGCWSLWRTARHGPASSGIWTRCSSPGSPKSSPR